MKRAARHKTGSVVFDKRRGTWRFLQWISSRRRSQTIGTKQEFPTKTAAWREAERIRLSSETVTSDEAGTVKALAARYEAERFPTRHDTARVYRSWLRKHILPEWGDKPVSEIQPRAVELWLRSLALSPKSKSHVRNMLYMLMDFAMWCGALELARNPIELVVVKGATTRVRKPRSLTVEQFKKLNAELHEPFRTLAVVCICFGLRISECLALKWADVDWLNGKLRIERSIVEQHVDDVKTDESRKSLAIADELLERLKVLRRSTKFAADSDWIFASPIKIGRQPYSYTGVWRELQRAAESAGIGRLGTHSFRHSYRSWLDAVGTPIAVQQKLMRHSDIRTTMNIYGDIVTDQESQAHRKIVKLALMYS
jgi:integrase